MGDGWEARLGAAIGKALRKHKDEDSSADLLEDYDPEMKYKGAKGYAGYEENGQAGRGRG